MAAETLPEALLEPVAARFRVLGDATRLAILRRLVLEGELTVGQLVERLGYSQANISKHLRVLLDAHIVARRQVGTSAYYAVADSTVVRLCDMVCDRLRDEVEAEVRAFSGH